MATPEMLTNLPVPTVRRLAAAGAEQAYYVARPGLAALPSGTLAVIGFASPQIFSAYFILWAIWWPAPQTHGQWAFALSGTALMLVLAAGVVWLLLRRFPGVALGVVRAPFIRLTVTDRRVIWSLPWHHEPLLEIGRERIVGGILGHVDRRGRGNAAMVLIPGDPMGDVDGNIHFDRLPDVAGFVAALSPR